MKYVLESVYSWKYDMELKAAKSGNNQSDLPRSAIFSVIVYKHYDNLNDWTPKMFKKQGVPYANDNI